MASKSWPTTSMVQCGSSSKQLGRHTDPIIYKAEDLRSHKSGKTCKRNSEESLESAGKRRRTSHCPSEGCSQTSSGPSSSANAARSASANTGPPNKTSQSDSSACLPGPSTAAVCVTKDVGTFTPASVAISPEGTETKKRKSEETVGSRKKSRRTPSPSEGPRHQASTEPSTSDQPGTSSSVDTAPPHSRAAFMAKYKEEQLLGEGGYGSVFAGYRKEDKLPVAIKHISLFGIEHISVPVDGKCRMVPKEVALLLKLQPAAPGTSAVVALLDWYRLDNEMILVLERPVPCMDLVDYMNSKRSGLQEQEAKILTKQLVDALIEVHSKGVFHRDIKLDNILIETGSDVPRIRIIDFGCGTFLSEREYTEEPGTDMYFSPEWLQEGWYTAEPTTVWQLGVVLFGLLHRSLPFHDSSDIIVVDPDIREDLTDGCTDFLWSCLNKSPEDRATLNTLKSHPWLE